MDLVVFYTDDGFVTFVRTAAEHAAHPASPSEPDENEGRLAGVPAAVAAQLLALDLADADAKARFWDLAEPYFVVE